MGLTSRIYNVRTQLYKKNNHWKLFLALCIIILIIGICLIIISQKNVTCSASENFENETAKESAQHSEITQIIQNNNGQQIIKIINKNHGDTTNSIPNTQISINQETVGDYSKDHYYNTISMIKLPTELDRRLVDPSAVTSTTEFTFTSISSLPIIIAQTPKDKFIVLSKTDQVQEKFTNSMRKRSVSAFTSETNNEYVETESKSTTWKSSPSQESTTISTINLNTEPIDLSSAIKPFPLHVNEPCPKPIQECSTLECKKSAQRILSLMDHSVDPCDDFYRYACGGMSENNAENDLLLPDLRKLDDRFAYNKVAKIFYESCLNTQTEEVVFEVKKHLKKMVSIAENIDNAFTELLIMGLKMKPHKIHLPWLIFDIAAEIGIERLFIPTISVPADASWITNNVYETICTDSSEEDNETDPIKIYEKFMKCLQNNEIVQKTKEKAATLLISNIDKEWIDLMNASQKEETFNQSSSLRSKIVTIKQLQILMPRINWSLLFNKITKINITNSDKIQIKFHENVDEVFHTLNRISFNDLKTILLIHLAHDYYVNFIDTQLDHRCDRKRYCNDLMLEMMPDVMSKIYLKSQFNSHRLDAIDKVSTTIFSHIIQKLTVAIGMQMWLSDLDKNEIILKLADIKFLANVSSSIYSSDDTFMRHFETFYNLSKFSGNYLQNMFELKSIKEAIMWSSISKNSSFPENIWTHLLHPISSQPINVHEIIVIPLAITSKYITVKRKSRQIYEQHAELGFLIARQLAEYMDTKHMPTVLSQENEQFKAFVEIRLCDPQFARSSNIFNLKISKEEIISKSINIRFADDAAIRIVRETYEQFQPSILTADRQLIWLNYTIPKLFYLSAVQKFCQPLGQISATKMAIQLMDQSSMPSYFRINSMLMNSKNFAETYECPDGSTMNPAFKVDQFPYLADLHVDYFDTKINEDY